MTAETIVADLLGSLNPDDLRRLGELGAQTPVPEGRIAQSLNIARIDDLTFAKDLRLGHFGLDWPDSLRSGYVEFEDAIVTPFGFVIAGDFLIFNTQILPNGWMRGASGGAPDLVPKIFRFNYIHKLDAWRETCLLSIPAQMQAISQPAFLFNSRLACFNFAHFVQDTLVQTPTYRECCAEIGEDVSPVVVGPGFPNATMDEIFRVAVGPAAPPPLFLRNDFLRASRLFVPNTHISPAHNAVARGAVVRLNQTLTAGLAPYRGPARRLFIARTDSTRSEGLEPRFDNEPALVAALSELGFETVAASRLSTHDYLDAFVNAEILVGLHGAGLWNLMLAHIPRVVEINVPGFVDWHTFALLMQTGLGAPYKRVVMAPPKGNLASYDIPAIVEACRDLLGAPCPPAAPPL